MRLSHEELQELLKRPSVAGRNPDLSNPYHPPRKVAVMEPAIVDVSLGSASVQKTSRQSFRVRLVSVRERLLDEDNLSAKYVVDQIRYCGIIPDDNAPQTKIEITQRKCEEGEPEYVEVIVEKI